LLAASTAVSQAAPQVAAPSTPEQDDMTAARAALRASIDTLAKTKVPMAIEPVTHFKA
jgi:hypothetical protein